MARTKQTAKLCTPSPSDKQKQLKAKNYKFPEQGLRAKKVKVLIFTCRPTFGKVTIAAGCKLLFFFGSTVCCYAYEQIFLVV